MQSGQPAAFDSRSTARASIALYWLPLGAGGRFVHWNGRLFEAASAHHQHRRPADLYHSALVVRLESVRFVIEMTPVWGQPKIDHGVVQTGPVGARLLGHSALFRYEVRRWLNGTIGDVAEAVGTPLVTSHDPEHARTVLSIVSLVPALTWGRDELRTGDMWNSNSLTSWLLAHSGHDMSEIQPPANGRAPGWQAGLELASRQPVPTSAHRLGKLGF